MDKGGRGVERKGRGGGEEWRGRGREGGGEGEREGGQGISQFQKNGMNYCFLANTLRLYYY